MSSSVEGGSTYRDHMADRIHMHWSFSVTVDDPQRLREKMFTPLVDDAGDLAAVVSREDLEETATEAIMDALGEAARHLLPEYGLTMHLAPGVQVRHRDSDGSMPVVHLPALTVDGALDFDRPHDHHG